MVHKKYIKRGGKKFGPYYYENYRDENGKTRTIYHGLEHPDKKQKTLWVNYKKFLFVFVGILIVTSFFIFIYGNRGLTTEAILEIGETTPELGILGNLSLTLEPNEFIPAETSIIIQNGNETYEYYLRDLISTLPEQGVFYLLGTSISGEGLGFAAEVEYPTVFFELEIFKGDVRRRGGSSDEKEVKESKIEEEENKTAAKEAEEANKTKEKNKTITGNIINIFLGLKESFSNGPINVISGSVSFFEEFRYGLKGNEVVRVVSGSVKTEEKILDENVLDLNYNQETREIVVTTGYVGGGRKTYQLDTSNISHLLVPGEVKLILEYNGTEIFSVRDNLIQPNLSINTLQFDAIINEPVQWEKNVKINKKGIFRVRLPKEATNIKVSSVDYIIEETTIKGKSQKIARKVEKDLQVEKPNFFKRFGNRFRLTGNVIEIEETSDYKELIIDENATEFQITYQTPGPRSIETEIPKGKKILVTSDIHYENILAHTNLPEEVSSEFSISLFELENNTQIPVDFVSFDKNNNSLIDYIEWIIPNLSNRSYILIIEISLALHLDENRTIINEITNDVKYLDNNWSEPINENEFVRAKFTQVLDSSKDITIYPRGNATSIEVYEVNQTEVIATFTNITENEYNTVYLTNLSGTQDTFDLKILGGYLEFDHIVDPPAYNGSNIVYQCGFIDVAGNYEMNQSLSTTATTCLTINVSDVSLDCKNFNIDGIDSGGTFGIFSDGASGAELTNITINNCDITDLFNGIYFDYTNTSVIDNITATSNNRGIYFGNSDSNNITNITTNSNNIGILIDTSDSNNLTNITANSNSDSGILLGGDSNNLINITANSNNQYGILISNADSNTLTNITTNSNDIYGIFLNAADSNKVSNSTIEGAGDRGIFINGDHNIIENVTIKSSVKGISLQPNSDNNTIVNNTIEDNSEVGIYSNSAGANTPNLIYNNLLNNTLNVNLTGTIYTNYWNTTQQAGTRIYSNGADIGGNYWTNSTGNGFSDTCADADTDGFCDDGYNVTTDSSCTIGTDCSNNTDFLAYSDEYFDSNVSVCKTLDTSGSYKVINNLSTTTTCITITSSDVSLDCQNFNIDGDDGSSDYGIFSDGASGAELTNITIKNCNITDFNSGIRFEYTNTSSIDNITATSNTWSGIYLLSADSNNLTNLTANSNSLYGIQLTGTSILNNLTDITANSNSDRGIFIDSDSDSNTLKNVTANSNTNSGIFIDGDSNTLTNVTANSNTNYGIFFNSADSNTLTNVTANLNGFTGINLNTGSSNNILIDITSNSNSLYGIRVFFTADSNTLINVTANNNSNYGMSVNDDVTLENANLINNTFFDFFLEGSNGCSASKLTNITGTDNKPIYYTNESVNLQDWNNNVSAIILCNADNSVLNNITLSHTDVENNGILLSGTSNSNLTNLNINDSYYGIIFGDSSTSNILTNITTNSNTKDGIFLSSSNSNTFINITSNSNTQYGIYFSSSTSNTLTNITANSNTNHGISLASSSNSNTLTHITANSNSQKGVLLDNSNSNTLTNITVNSNADDGIYLDGNSHKVSNSTIEFQSGSFDVGIFIDDDHNIIENTVIKSNYRGIYLDSTADNNTIVNVTFESNSNSGIYMNSPAGTTPNLIYNNLLNNTANVFFVTPTDENYWNTTKQSGNRIFSDGTDIGGNYWTNSTGNGFSDTCTDANGDGFCDDGYNVTTDSSCTIGIDCSNNTDFLAYSDKGPIVDCTDITSSGAYQVGNDLSTTTTCITITISDVSLDCQNFNIDGDDSGTTDYGIFSDGAVGSELTNVTIKNCDITDFYYGIYFDYTNTSVVDNVIANSNSRGIYINNADSNTLTNVTSNSNTDNGILLSNSDSNTFTNITANSNSFYGIWLSNADSNTLTNITANSNSVYGIYIAPGNSNNLTNITANSNGNTGIYLDGNSNEVRNSIIEFQSGNNDVGIFIDDDHNIIENTVIKSNYRGIYLDTTTDNNTIINVTVENNSDFGIYLFSAGPNTPNKIYNNLLNNTANVNFVGTIYTNYWNTTKQTGNRIYSNGADIGGNYWTNSTGNGFSDTCVDGNGDGFCDDGYNVTTDTSCSVGVNCSINTDFLAYSDEFVDPFDVSVCKTLDTSGNYKVINDLSTTTTCLTINVSDVSLDCKDFNIDGDDSGTDYGIFSDGTPGSELTNITIKNCDITDFNIGIRFDETDSSSIDNVTSTSNTNDGVEIFASNSNTLTNITANSNTVNGIELVSADSTTLTNITANSNNQYGIRLSTSNLNTFTNINLINNTRFDFFPSSPFADCSLAFTNVTVTDNKPIYYTNETVNLQDWNNNASLIILCNADNSVLNNITMFHTDKENNGILIMGTTINSNFTNLNISDSYSALYLVDVDSSILENITANSNTDSGIYLDDSDSNTLTNITANSNSQYGIELDFGSDSNTLTNITANSNNVRGISLDGNSNEVRDSVIENQSGSFDRGIFIDDDHNIIENVIIKSNYYGIWLDSTADNNTIVNNTFENNTDTGIYLSSAGLNTPNLIYNNLLNNTNNTLFAGTVYTNYWNTTQQTGNRIYSNGADIGGNYWTNSTGNGFSDTCTDSNGDGFCDDGYNVTNDVACTVGVNCSTTNTDFLSYSDEFVDFDVSVCKTLDTSGSYKVINDLDSFFTRCLTINVSDVSLDCQDFTLDGFDGAGQPGDYGIFVDGAPGAELTNITIKNCDITEFERGIYFEYTNTSVIDNVTSYLNSDFGLGGYGIYLSFSDSNNITNTTTSNSNKRGIGFSNSASNNLTNITANSNIQYGIYLFNADSNTLTDITANTNSQYGVYFSSTSDLNTLENSTLLNNTQWDFFTDADTATECNNQLTNITGTDNKPIVYYNSSVTLEHWNNNASEIILCDADNSVLNNITMSHVDKENNGILLTGTSNSNLTNIDVNDSYRGIYLSFSADSNTLTNITANSNTNYGFYISSDSNTLTNITANSNSADGIFLNFADSNTLTNITANSNNYGIFLNSADLNTLTNITANSNTISGIRLDGNSNKVSNSTIESQSGPGDEGIYIDADHNIIENTIIKSNYYGIYLDLNADNNTIINNTFEANSNYGIYIRSSGLFTPNLIYNNLLNNTANVFFDGTIYTNYWNTTKQSGNRIFSSGTQIGGNYWSNSSAPGTGFSDTCTDSNTDGFCDDGYNVTNDVACTVGVNCSTTNTDYLSYSDEWVDPFDVTVCKTLDTSGTYTVQNDLSTTTTCLTITVSDVSLDCQNYNLDGDESGTTDAGIFADGAPGSELTNITINNCNTTDFQFGIHFDYVDNSVIDNVTVSSASRGIYLNFADSNNLTNITANSNTRGIYLEDSNSNNLTNINSSSNNQYGVWLDASNSNNLTNITANSNTNYGIYIFISNSNNLTNITANSNLDRGVQLLSSDNNILTDITANSNSLYGVFFDSASTSNKLENSTLINNTRFDFFTDGDTATECNNQLINITGTDNKPIYYTNESVNLQDWNNNASEIILCDADNSVLNNITLSHVDVENNGILLTGTSNSNLTNLNVSDSYYGIYLINSLSNILTNITANSNTQYGIWVSTSSDSNTLTNITANTNSVYGIYLEDSNSNNLTNITANSNSFYGIPLISSDSNILTNILVNSNTIYGIYLAPGNSNILTNITANSNGNTGIYLDGNSNKVSNSTIQFQSGTNDRGIFIDDDHTVIENTVIKSNYRGIYLDTTADNNTIINVTIENNSDFGIYLFSAGPNTPNLFYNNLLNNTANVIFTGTINTNYWNTTKQSGTRIYSNGTDIGGNYWTNSTGNGFSDTCTDSNGDGFCDLRYNVTTDSTCAGINCGSNTDDLAYSDEFIADSIFPNITFVLPTTASGNYSQNYIEANVTASDANLDTITINLYNSTDLVQSNTSSTSPFFVNFTNLSDETYSLNATANDTANNVNKTETRNITLILPNLTIIRPENETYFDTIELLLNFTVSFENFVWYNIDGGTNTTISGNTTFNASEGQRTLNLYANNTVGETLESTVFTVNLSKFKIIYNNYSGNTSGSSTNFNQSSFEDIQNLSGIILENTDSGRIEFNETLNLTNDSTPNDNEINLDINIDISFNKIEINSTALPNFNKSATLYLYGLTFTNPRILKDGSVCPSNICIKESYSGGVLKFNVTGFSTYSAEETPSTPSGGGGGGVSSCTYNWDCSEWSPSPCPENEIQTRLCVNRGSCDGREEIPSQDRTCNFTGPTEPLFDLFVNVPLILKVISQGSDIEIDVKLINLGELSKVDVFLKYTVINENNKLIITLEETRAIEVKDEFKVKLILPEDLERGIYRIFVEATYDTEKIAIAEDTFRVSGIVGVIIYYLIIAMLIVSILITVILIYYFIKENEILKYKLLLSRIPR